MTVFDLYLLYVFCKTPRVPELPYKSALTYPLSIAVTLGHGIMSQLRQRDIASVSSSLLLNSRFNTHLHNQIVK